MSVEEWAIFFSGVATVGTNNVLERFAYMGGPWTCVADVTSIIDTGFSVYKYMD